MVEPIGLRTTKQWMQLQNQICKISEFYPTPGAEVKNQEVVSIHNDLPYAMFRVESKLIPAETEVNGFCTHKQDFENLWAVFKEWDLDVNTQEVILFWSKTHYAKVWAKLLSFGMPRMVLMICPRGTYERSINTKWVKGEGIGELADRLHAEACFRPEVMKKS